MVTFTFDPGVEQGNYYEPVPEGDYLVQITEVVETVSKAGNPYLNFKFTILDGEYKDRSFFQSFNIFHPNEQARKISTQNLFSLCKALGYKQACQIDTDELTYRPMKVLLKIRENAGYEPRNVIAAYAPCPQSVVPQLKANATIASTSQTVNAQSLNTAPAFDNTGLQDPLADATDEEIPF